MRLVTLILTAVLCAVGASDAQAAHHRRPARCHVHHRHCPRHRVVARATTPPVIGGVQVPVMIPTPAPAPALVEDEPPCEEGLTYRDAIEYGLSPQEAREQMDPSATEACTGE